MEKTTTVVMTPIELETFKRFRRHEQMFVLMEQSGVFEIQFGKCILNFYKGNMQNIVKEEMMYSILHKKTT